MYKKNRNRQISFSDFNQPMGLKMNPENRWVKRANMIPWADIEDKYAELFPSHTGMPAKPLRMALGSLIIQKQLSFSDEELVEQLRENPYFQYFIGLPGFQDKKPFVPSLLVEFRKRLSDEILGEINEMILAYNDDDDDPNPGRGGSDDTTETSGNKGTMILDATCAPQNIAFPTDVNLLNEARENLERIIDSVCESYGEVKPRMYRKVARKKYLQLAKAKKPGNKKIRKAIKQQLQFVRRDFGYLEKYLEMGLILNQKQLERLSVIQKLYEQQLQMYESKTHQVADRIVSISQPYIRPISRGKLKAPTEFGAKFDISLDHKGLTRTERISFKAYNESTVLKEAVERFRERNGFYPEAVLADKIYRNRENIAYCKENGIRLSGPPLGRPPKNPPKEYNFAYRDNADRVAVERAFSLAKRCFGLNCIRTKREDTTKGSIALAIIMLNLNQLARVSFLPNVISIFSRYKQRLISLIYAQNGEAVLTTCY